jgi:hypothetical protein
MLERVASTRQRAETELTAARLRHMTKVSRAIAARHTEVPMSRSQRPSRTTSRST